MNDAPQDPQIAALRSATEKMATVRDQAQAAHRPIQSVVVWSLGAIVCVLVVTLVAMLIYFTQLQTRKTVAQEAVACFSEKNAAAWRDVTALLGTSSSDPVDQKAKYRALQASARAFKECQ